MYNTRAYAMSYVGMLHYHYTYLCQELLRICTVTYPRGGPQGPWPLSERPQGAPQAPKYFF